MLTIIYTKLRITRQKAKKPVMKGYDVVVVVVVVVVVAAAAAAVAAAAVAAAAAAVIFLLPPLSFPLLFWDISHTCSDHNYLHWLRERSHHLNVYTLEFFFDVIKQRKRSSAQYLHRHDGHVHLVTFLCSGWKVLSSLSSLSSSSSLSRTS